MNGWPPKELSDAYPIQVVNRVAFQRPSTSLCGYYSILFAKAMDRMEHHLTQKGFEKLLHDSIV